MKISHKWLASAIGLAIAAWWTGESMAASACAWAWMKGSTATEPLGIYGTQGVPSAANVPGGRENAAALVDAGGKLWLYGGHGLDHEGVDGFLGDLWHYDLATGYWGWMKGQSDANQIGIYGTQAVPGAANVPGTREPGAFWIDGSGNLWLFGGFGFDSTGLYGCLSDLWRFNPATRQWTWVKGSIFRKQPGVYGTQGIPASDNIPGSREEPGDWANAAGTLWLMGGIGFDAVGVVEGLLNDLWRYDPATGNWVWLKGASLIDQPGTYGTAGVEHPDNVPGGLFEPVTWLDASGKLWLFGG